MIVKTYMARPGSMMSHDDARRVGTFIDKEFGERTFTPQELLEKARPEKSPIHGDFDWDRDVAAEKWNLQQARQLIASIMLVEETKSGEVTTRAFHHVVERSLTGKASVYVADHVVWQEPYLAAQVIERAKREFTAWQRRYTKYSELRDWALAELEKGEAE